MDYVKFEECKRLTCYNKDGCFLFNPSYENPLFCDCCTCHRNFHHAIYNIPPNSGVYVKKYIMVGLMIANCFIMMGPMLLNTVHVDTIDHYISLHHQYHHHIHIKITQNLIINIIFYHMVILCLLMMIMNIQKKC